jgi:hypothetical protein
MSSQEALSAAEQPDHVEFDGAVIGWDAVSPEGWAARIGVIEPGFSGKRPVVTTGERIRLYEATGQQELEISVLDEQGRAAAIYHLGDENSMIEVHGDREMRLATPEGQGPIRYMTDYPGVWPPQAS